jgi:hypothetical protein
VPTLLRRIAPSLMAGALTAILVADAVAQVPEPVLVVPSGAADGQVTLEPAVQEIAPGEAGRWILTNGGPDTLVFGLTAHRLDIDDAGTPQLGQRHRDVRLPTSQITLAPGEQTRIVAYPPSQAPRGLALAVRSRDAAPAVTLAAVAVPAGGTVAPRVTLADRAGEVVVRLDADEVTVADVRIRMRAWPGITVADATLRDVLVAPPGRTLVQPVAGFAAGRITVEVLAGRGAAGTLVTQTGWWWPRSALLALAAIVLVVAAAVVVGVWWRRRRGASDVSPAPPP